MDRSLTFTAKRSVSTSPYLQNCRLTTPDRELYKTRLEVFFKHYPSKNFDGRPWGELSEIMLVRQHMNCSLSKQC